MQINTFLEQCVALGHILKVVVFGTWKWPASLFRPVGISGLLYRPLNSKRSLGTCHLVLRQPHRFFCDKLTKDNGPQRPQESLLIGFLPWFCMSK